MKNIMNDLMRLARTFGIKFCKVLQDYTKLEEEGLGITELEEYYKTQDKSQVSNIKEI